MDTTNLAAMIPDIIQPEVERAATAVRVFRAPLIREFGFTGPGGTLDLLDIGSLTASPIAELADRTFVTDTPNATTLTPAEIDVAMQFSDKSMRRTILNAPLLYGAELGRALANGIDGAAVQEYTNFGISGPVAGAYTLQAVVDAIGRVQTAVGDQGGMISAVIHSEHWAKSLTDNVVQLVDVRGQGSALMSGMLTTLGGHSVYFTSAIITATNNQNMIFSQRAIALSWKTLAQTDSWRGEDNKSQRIAATADFDVVTWFAGEGQPLETTPDP